MTSYLIVTDPRFPLKVQVAEGIFYLVFFPPTILVPKHPETSHGNHEIRVEHNMQAAPRGSVGWRRYIPTESTNQRSLYIWTIIKLGKHKKRYRDVAEDHTGTKNTKDYI